MEGIIILLGSPNDEEGQLSSIGIERANCSIEEYRKHPDYKILPTGGFGEHFNKTLSVSDRKQAIKTALKLASSGDIVLVAGKGHEDYQDILGVKHHFDDKEIIQEILKSLDK